MKPLTTEPPLDPPLTREEKIRERRNRLFKKELLEEEARREYLSLEYELELEHQAMQALDDEEYL